MDNTNAVESLVRRLASVEERLGDLKETGENIRSSIFSKLEAAGADKIETIYGRVNVKNTKEFDYSEFPEVVAAMAALEVAKAQLKAAQEAAKAKAPVTVKRTLAFTRNKAVSARAKKGRIYVQSFIRRVAVAA